MAKQSFGILAFCMFAAAILIGMYGISLYSLTTAGIYLAGCIVLFITFVFAYCTKCPIRKKCVHVVMGLMTSLMPDRPAGRYTFSELAAVFTFYGFVTLFPQYWLINNPVLMLAFWTLFIGEWILNHYTICRACENIHCKLRCDAP